MFCPKCKAEFREGFTYCVTCQENLVDALEVETENDGNTGGEVFSAENAVFLVNTRDEIEASMIEAILKDNGILTGKQRSVGDDYMSIIAGNGNAGIDIYVNESDYETAIALLNSDWENEETEIKDIEINEAEKQQEKESFDERDVGFNGSYVILFIILGLHVLLFGISGLAVILLRANVILHNVGYLINTIVCVSVACAALLALKGKKIGWYGICGFYTGSVLISIPSVLIAPQSSGSLLRISILLLVWGLILWFFLRDKITEGFDINKRSKSFYISFISGTAFYVALMALEMGFQR